MSTPESTPDAESAPAPERSLGLDMRLEPSFEQITALAARLFNVPVALVSLIDGERYQFKSAHGVDLREMPRDQAFCAHAVLDQRVFIVPDAAADERFAANDLVTGAPGIRFYAGAPLTDSAGANIGALCVVDTVPRQFDAADAALLKQLATMTMTAINNSLTEQRLLREVQVHEQTARALREVEQRYDRIVRHSPGLVYQFVRRANGDAEFLFVSDSCRDILGLEPSALEADANEYFKLLPPGDMAKREGKVAEAIAALKSLRWEGWHFLPTGESKWVQVVSQPTPAANGMFSGTACCSTSRIRSARRTASACSRVRWKTRTTRSS